MIGSGLKKLANENGMKVAQGVAYGTSGHVVGTSKASELGDLPAAAGSLSLVIAGILTAILFPLLTRLIG